MSVEATLEEYCSLPERQRRVLSVSEISSFTDGVVLVLSVWSGPAIMMLTSLCRVLSDSSLMLGVIDSDAIGESNLTVLGCTEPLHGYGDAFWLLRGEVVATVNAKYADYEELARQHTAQLEGSLS